MALREWPIPPHYDPGSVAAIRRVPYQQRADEAVNWAQRHGVEPAHRDTFRLGLLIVDAQNTFCIPGFELFVAGRSGSGAVEDNRRLCQFIYRNLGAITAIVATLDTHLAFQIFHPTFLVDPSGNHPPPYTLVSVEEVEGGRWRFNEALAPTLGIEPEYGQRHLLHYVRALREKGKYSLTVWPYHSMQGGIGHALVAAVEEALFFHAIARHGQTEFLVKGRHPLTEHYSVLGPEVATGPDGAPLATREQSLIDRLLRFDALAVAGQAKSHCLAWTIDDLLERLDRRLAERVYLLEDCSSPVVVPGLVDYTEEAEAAFRRFARAGMHVVHSTLPLSDWPGIAPRRSDE